MDSVFWCSTPAEEPQKVPASDDVDDIKLFNQYEPLGADPTSVLQQVDWENVPSPCPLALSTASPRTSVPLDVDVDPAYSPPLSQGALTQLRIESHVVVCGQQGRECEVIQSRGDRRRAQNRRAQRAYRARKEAQLKEASSVLAKKQSQLSSLSHHNRELVETIKRLKATIVQLEAENQLLKEIQSPNDGLVEPWNFMTTFPAEMALDGQR